MRIEFVIGGKNFSIVDRIEPDLGMYFILFERLNEQAQWKDTGAGKQWSKSIQEAKGGQMGYIKFLLESINDFLEALFKDNPDVPKTELELLMDEIKRTVVVSGNRLKVSE